jgi:predicted nucleic acid-binding Zn ribbon protein
MCGAWAFTETCKTCQVIQMPTYEFECDNEQCESNARIEQWMSINEPHDLECPFCHSSMHKVKQTYGLYQMKVKSLRKANTITQFWMYHTYVGRRYGWTDYEDPNYCKALHHLKTKGWQ